MTKVAPDIGGVYQWKQMPQFCNEEGRGGDFTTIAGEGGGVFLS